MTFVECKTQAQLDKVKVGDIGVVREGSFEARDSSRVIARDSSRVIAWDSSHVVAYDSSHVIARGSSHVEARGSSHVVARDSSHVEARDSSHVEAWGSSHVEALHSSHVVARDSSHVEARDSSRVIAYGFVSTHIFGKTTKVTGGNQIRVSIGTARKWCAYYGIKVVKGLALVYKAVDDDYTTDRGTIYAPGTKPIAADWDGGKDECGGGLHFSPTPRHAKEFNNSATKFVGCWVKITEMRKPKNIDQYPQKCKAKQVIKPCFEVNEDGERI